MRSQSGVTAVSMAIVIVLIVILAGFTVLSSRDVVNEANVQKYYQEIKVVSDGVTGLSLDRGYFNDTFESFKVNDISEYNLRTGNRLKENRVYYLLGFGEDDMTEVLRASLYEVLDVRNVENSYIISLEKPGDVEVILLDGVRGENGYLYTYDEIHDSYADVLKK